MLILIFKVGKVSEKRLVQQSEFWKVSRNQFRFAGFPLACGGGLSGLGKVWRCFQVYLCCPSSMFFSHSIVEESFGFQSFVMPSQSAVSTTGERNVSHEALPFFSLHFLRAMTRERLGLDLLRELLEIAELSNMVDSKLTPKALLFLLLSSVSALNDRRALRTFSLARAS